MGEPYLGEIRPFGFNYAPRGWAFCNGDLLPINDNTALFSLLGTQFGGDGRTNFALPDLRGRTPIHTGPGYSVGAYGGLEEVTLTQATMPAHTHAFNAIDEQADQFAITNTRMLAIAGDSAYSNAANLVTMASSSTTSTGGGSPHNNMQPYQTVNYCIALLGYYPPRD